MHAARDLKAGDKITVVGFGGLVKVLLTAGPLTHTGSAVAREYRERKVSGTLYPIKHTVSVDLPVDQEGITWARGWDGEAAGALRAARALEGSR